MGDGQLALSLNYRYVSELFYNFEQEFAYNKSSDRGYLNARASYAFGDAQQYSVSLWGNNLTEEFACARTVNGPGAAPLNFSCEASSYGKALYGLTFEASFGE